MSWNKWFFTKISLNDPSKVFRGQTYENRSRWREIDEYTYQGVEMIPLGVYVDQKTLVFPGSVKNYRSTFIGVRTFIGRPVRCVCSLTS